MSTDKKVARLRRAKRSREHIKSLRQPRLSIHCTPQHIYVQLISADGTHTLATASTLEKEVQKAGGDKCNIASAKVVGQTIAARAQKVSVTKVAFDRSGFKYHGRVKALADAAREGGLDF
jgi:large subunit ribosomal protein L18